MMQEFQNNHRKRLVLYLAGTWSNKINKLLMDDDILCCAPDLMEELKEKKDKWELIPRTVNEKQACLVKQYMRGMQNSNVKVSVEPAFSTINNHYNYGLIPVVAYLDFIQRKIENEKITEILIITVSEKNLKISTLGYKNSESNFGTRDLIGAIVGKIICNSFENIPKQKIILKCDFLLNTKYRRVFFYLATIFMVMRSSLILLMLGIINNKRNQFNCEGVIFIRTKEHARHAIRIIGKNPNLISIITPQYYNGSVSSILEPLQKENINIIFPPAIVVLKSLCGALMNRVEIKSAGFEIKFKKFSIPIDISEFYKDYNCFKIYEFQRLIINNTIKQLKKYSKIKYSLGFETQGQFAWMEGLEPRKYSILTKGVQTVLIQSSPMPVFPFSNEFLVDSLPNVHALKEVGAERFGSVMFNGPPFEIVDDRVKNSSMRNIGFFTECYETEKSIDILNAICAYARKSNDVKIHVRLHPRNKIYEYSEVLKTNSDVCFLSDKENLESMLRVIDVGITRVSSVIKEGIAYGCPMISVQLSQFDLNVKADYLIRNDNKIGTTAYSLEELILKLNDFDGLYNNFLRLQDHLFGKYKYTDFIDGLKA